MKPQVPEGLHVRYQHHRYLAADVPGGQNRTDGKRVLSPKGGWTTAVIWEDVPVEVGQEPQKRVIATGIAYCHLNDNFNRKIGRDIALGRAIKGLHRDQHGVWRKLPA